VPSLDVPEHRLNDLHPRWILDETTGLQVGLCFTCPVCPDGHTIRFLFGTTWRRTGHEFHVLTLTPSVDATAGSCGFHGWITNGEVRW
jgi:hypothetical protein